jgi:MFS family permease
MTDIDPSEAASALSDIDDVARRVRQSTIYRICSLIMIMWGTLVFAGYLVTYLSPQYSRYAWPVVYVAGIVGSFAISARGYPRTRIRSFNFRTLAAFLLFIAFGIFVNWLGHFTPRQVGTFWPIYFMLVYTIAGLWVGPAFVAIGLGVTAFTLIGYFFSGVWFDLWMAVANGGGLMLGGLWMRRS